MSSLQELEAILVRVSEVDYGNMVLSNCITLSYGIYLSLFVLAFRVLSQKYRSSQATFILFMVHNVIFISTTLAFSCALSAYLCQMDWARRTSPDLSIRQRLNYGNAAFQIPSNIATFAQSFNFILGDGIVIWRAYILYDDQLIARIALVLLFLGSSAVAFAHFVYSITDDINSIQGIMYFLSFGCNFIATSAIAWKAWRHRSLLKETNAGKLLRNRSTVLPILYFLTETGFIFCLLQLTAASLFIYHENRSNSPFDPGSMATQIIINFTVIYAGMYPSIVILLINKQRSVIDNSILIDPESSSSTIANQRHALNDMGMRSSGRGHELSAVKFADLHQTTSGSTMPVGGASMADSYSFK